MDKTLMTEDASCPHSCHQSSVSRRKIIKNVANIAAVAALTFFFSTKIHAEDIIHSSSSTANYSITNTVGNNVEDNVDRITPSNEMIKIQEIATNAAVSIAFDEIEKLKNQQRYDDIIDLAEKIWPLQMSAKERRKLLETLIDVHTAQWDVYRQNSSLEALVVAFNELAKIEVPEKRKEAYAHCAEAALKAYEWTRKEEYRTEAEKCAKRAIPHYKSYIVLAELAAWDGKYQEAIKLLKESLSILPVDVNENNKNNEIKKDIEARIDIMRSLSRCEEKKDEDKNKEDGSKEKEKKEEKNVKKIKSDDEEDIFIFEMPLLKRP